jgi:hypothetical protein
LATRRFASDFPSLLSARGHRTAVFRDLRSETTVKRPDSVLQKGLKREELGEDPRANTEDGLILVGVWLAWPAVSRAEQPTAAPPEQAEELAKKLANPVSDLVSVPF